MDSIEGFVAAVPIANKQAILNTQVERQKFSNDSVRSKWSNAGTMMYVMVEKMDKKKYNNILVMQINSWSNST